MRRPTTIAVLLTAMSCFAYDVERSTDLGPVGGRKITVLGRTIEEYQGIPFAEPPIGELRFRPPIPAKPWKGTLNATGRLTACPQPLLPPLPEEYVEYGEDCLHLHIVIPEGSLQAPVLVWIHGGGFSYGSASYDDCSVIAAKAGLVVVAINYRLGILGFLYANNSESPGNMGLLDQNLALKWVKNNIENFGGDPSRITLAGISAGGVSVHAHMFSPMSRGLFWRAIAMSGVINAPDFTDSPRVSLSKGDAVAAFVGCNLDNKTLASHPDEVIGCMRTKSADELVQAVSKAVPARGCPIQPTYHDAFLPEEPSEALRTGSFDTTIDFLTGVTSDEGFTMFSWNKTNPEFGADSLDNVDPETLNSVVQKAADSWFKDVPPSLLVYDPTATTSKESFRRNFVQYLGDRLFVCPMHTAATAHASHGGTVYTYVFDHWPAKRAPLSWAGVGHGMDIPFLFGDTLLDNERANFSDEDIRVTEQLLTMMSTFAGIPASPSLSSWSTYTASSPFSMVLNGGNITIVDGFHIKDCASSSRHI